MKAIRFYQPFLRRGFQPTGIRRTLVDPSTEQPLPVAIEEANAAMVEEAVRSAREALPVWNWQFTAQQRRTALLRIADGLEENREEIAYLESWNGGKPIAEARFDVDDSIEVFRHFAGYADKLHGRISCASPRLKTYTLREPVGVCGLITSYNYPLVLVAWKLAPALACGNTVVVKPHQLTPLSALYLGHLCQEKGNLPPGVVSILPGGADVGEAITKHPDIDKVSFTGSGGVGKHVMAASAKSNFKNVTLELGGKSPLVVFADCDLDRAVEDVYGAIFTNMGQNCAAGSRLYLERSIHDTFLEKFKERCKHVKIGNAVDPKFHYGPIVDRVQFTKIMSHIERAKKRGVSLLCGGSRFGTSGYFIPPTVFHGVDDQDPLAREEIFGPVLTVLKPFDTEEEAITRANDSPFGLAAGVWTNDANRVDRMVRQLQAGTTWVNCYNLIVPGYPFGGLKESGIGTDLGEECVLSEFTSTRTVFTSIASDPSQKE